MYITQQIRARTSGNANLDIGEIWASGTIDIRLFARMKKNSDARKGANGSPFGPTTSRAMPSRTSEEPDSPMNWSFPGTIDGLRTDAMRKASIPIVAIHRMIVIRVISKGIPNSENEAIGSG